MFTKRRPDGSRHNQRVPAHWPVGAPKQLLFREMDAHLRRRSSAAETLEVVCGTAPAAGASSSRPPNSRPLGGSRPGLW